MGDLLFFGEKTLGCVKTKKYSDRIYGIELTGCDKLDILNVYLPYDNIVYFAKGEPRNVEYCKVFLREMQYMGAQN